MAYRQQPPTTTKPDISSGINPAVDVAQTIQRGEIPSTAEVATILEKSERSLDEKLVTAEDEKTRTLVRDTQAAMGATKEFVESKNVGSRLQAIYKESALAAQSGEDFPTAVGLTDEDRRILREIRARFLEGSILGREVLKMIIMNASFREGLLTMLRLASDIFYQVGDQVMKEQPPAAAGAKPKKRAEKAKQTIGKEMKKQGGRTEAQRLELTDRLRKFLSQLRDSDVYQRGVSNLFRLADLVKVSVDKTAEKLDKMDVELQTEPHTKKALEETKQLAEEFLPGEKTLDPLLDKLKDFIVAIKKDEALAAHMKAWRNYVEKSIKNPGELSSAEFLKEGDKLVEDAVNLKVSDELKNAGKETLNEWQDVFESFKQDEQLNVLNVTMKKLIGDITTHDASGRTTIDLDALSRFRPIVVELLKKNLDKIPLPDVKGEDETYKWRAWNIIAQGSEILPDFISVETATKSEAAIRDTNRPSWLQGDLIIAVQNIRVKMENVEFWYHRKTFPSGEDKGFMDIDVAGGINVVIKLFLEARDNGLVFTDGSVYCRADDVRVRLRDTKHDILYNMFSGSWERPIRDNIEKFVAEKLADAIKDFKEAANERVREIQKQGVQAMIPEALKEQITA